MARFYVISFARGRAFHVMDGQDGLPIYDGKPYGNDKPVIFHDEDAAQEVADRLNAGSSDPGEPADAPAAAPEAGL